jgi:hypothetical protein
MSQLYARDVAASGRNNSFDYTREHRETREPQSVARTSLKGLWILKGARRTGPRRSVEELWRVRLSLSDSSVIFDIDREIIEVSWSSNEAL